MLRDHGAGRIRCGVSERTLTRKFTEATGLTPLRYQQLLRLERAKHLISHGATVEAAAGRASGRGRRRFRAGRRVYIYGARASLASARESLR